ncbi:MAG: hypothetical protein ABIQ26_17495 [Streptosporangiaceae bacterium]
MTVLVVLALAALAVVAAVVVLASGRGGELLEARPDHPPTGLPVDRPIQGTDAALLRLPKGLWGYNVPITDDALNRLAYSLTERDTRVSVLEQQLNELRDKLEARDAGPGPGRDSPWFLHQETSEPAWSPEGSWRKAEEQPE